jgi:hypothetical protein
MKELLSAVILRRDPANRPSGDEVLRRLGTAHPELGAEPTKRKELSLVGRDNHLQMLAAAFALVQQGKPAAVFISGRSGAGKSALANLFLESLREAGQAVILEGQCYQTCGLFRSLGVRPEKPEAATAGRGEELPLGRMASFDR